MNKGCKTCALDGILAYRNTCKNCVESGTFSGWESRTCQNCAHRFLTADVEPCKTCFANKSFPKVYTMWKVKPADTELTQTAEDAKPDTVNHPTHYTTGCGFECIEMMEMIFGKEAVHDFCALNAFKYLWRHRQKGGADDIGKAKWYLEYTKGLGIFKNRQAIDKMTDHIAKLKGEATK